MAEEEVYRGIRGLNLLSPLKEEHKCWGQGEAEANLEYGTCGHFP